MKKIINIFLLNLPADDPCLKDRQLRYTCIFTNWLPAEPHQSKQKLLSFHEPGHIADSDFIMVPGGLAVLYFLQQIVKRALVYYVLQKLLVTRVVACRWSLSL